MLIIPNVLIHITLPLPLTPHSSQGILKGFDQTINLVLEQSHERIFSEDAGVVQNVLGLYIIRGDNM